MGNGVVAFHDAGNVFADLREVEAALDESADGNFVGGVEDGGKGAADFAGAAGETQGGETNFIRLFEGELAELGEAGLDALAWLAFGIGQGVLNRQAHVRRGKLGEHGAIDKFDHGMNDALRVDNDADAVHADVEEPAGFDHFEAFVEERGGIDGDFLAHDPRRML